MISGIARWWRKRQRGIDIDILWKACKDNASTRHDAEEAFYLHCINDIAWAKDFNQFQINEIIRRLT